MSASPARSGVDGSQSAAGAERSDYHDLTEQISVDRRGRCRQNAARSIGSRSPSRRPITGTAGRHADLPGLRPASACGATTVPVGWAWDITNFVFWIGIGHAGTLISAILFLFRQKWRTSINRSAEAMTLFAVMCAGIFPLFHIGRPWRAYWLFPMPNPI